ncbi:hypothetical protein [Sphingopyxis sp.]|uniref:hypothetical protein n=1 Tax=Sphingopyxis sp. TaxID=1908224 RepID=UPI003F707117
MGTLTAATDGTATGYSDGSIGGPVFGSFTGTIGGLTPLIVATDTATPDQIEIWTADGTFATMNGKPLDVGGTLYVQASCTPFTGLALRSIYTATGFSFVNASVYAIDLATYSGPTVVGVTIGVGGAGSVPISFSSSGRASGDRLFMLVATANQAVPSLSGWPVVTPDSGDPFRGTAGAAGGIRATLLSKVSDGTEGTVTVGDSGDIQFVVGIVIRGNGGAAVDLDVSIAGNAAATTSGSFTGLTTPGNQRLALTFVATDRDASGGSWSGEANSSLGNLTERYDNGTATNTGAGAAIYSGEKIVAGATGTTTATQAASAAYAFITLAVKNAAGGGTTIGTANETDAALPLARLQIRGVGRADVADAALPLARLQIRGVGRADVDDAALPLSRLQHRPIGRADEINTALPQPSGGTAIGAAAETDLALGLAAMAFSQIGTANEIGAAAGLAAVQISPIGTGGETDGAQSLASRQSLEIGPAIGTNTGSPIASMQIGAVGAAATADSALTQAVIALVALGRAAEGDAALALGSRVSIGIGAGAEIDGAGQLLGAVVVAIGAIAELDGALPFTSEELEFTPHRTVRHRQQMRGSRPVASAADLRLTQIPERPRRRFAAARSLNVSRGRR